MAKTAQREHFVGDESGVMVEDGFLGTGMQLTLQWYSVNLDRLKMLLIEAHSPEEAKGIYNREMGIIYTVHRHDVQLVTGGSLKDLEVPRVPYPRK